MSGVADRVTVGVTPRGAERLAELMNTGWFNEEIDAFRISIGVAIAKGVCTDAAEVVNVRTKFNVGSLDNDGLLRKMITVLAPEESGERPFDYAERLADAGLALLSERLAHEGALLSDVLGDASG